MVNVEVEAGAEAGDVALLREELAAEQRKNKALNAELHKHRELLVKNSLEAEAEEECIINKLNKKLQQLAKEKERLALEVEREEELISNTLQKQLAQLRRDKVDLENQMEQEQECMVNKLQRQVAIMEKHKEEVQLRRADDAARVGAFVEDCLRDCMQALEPEAAAAVAGETDAQRADRLGTALEALRAKLASKRAALFPVPT